MYYIDSPQELPSSRGCFWRHGEFLCILALIPHFSFQCGTGLSGILILSTKSENHFYFQLGLLVYLRVSKDKTA